MSRSTATTPAHQNPYRSRRVEELAFRLPAAQPDWSGVLARLHQCNFRAAVVGPHGSGKTTFLLQLAQRLESRGMVTHRLFRHRGDVENAWADWRRALQGMEQTAVVIADGYDTLTVRQRWELRRCLRPRGGLLVTAHRRSALPTLLRTYTSPELLRQLVDELLQDQPGASRPSDSQIRQLFKQTHGNLREALRRLYLAV